MLSPYKIEGLTKVKAYYIDQAFFDLFIVENELVFKGSVFDNFPIVRSLLLKFFKYDNQFISDLYNENDSEEVVYIVEYNTSEKYLISFQVKDQDPVILEKLLLGLREKRSEIKSWFQNHVGRTPSNRVLPLGDIFPSYEIPAIPANILKSGTLTPVNIKHISLNKIEIHNHTGSNIYNAESIKFNIGDTSYTLPIKCIEKDRVNEMICEILFSSHAQLAPWIRFVTAIQIRNKKLLDDA